MSNEAITRVITNDTTGGASHRLTLMVLADMVNPAGFCWVSLDKLAERVQSVKRRQLVNVLADLEARGEVGVLRRKREQGRNGVNYYTVNAGLNPQQQRAALVAAEQHARANGWISELDCTNNDAGLVQSSTDISATDCTNQNGISAIQYQGLVQSSTDISAMEYQVLVQSAALDPSYDPIENPEDEPMRERGAPPPEPPDPPFRPVPEEVQRQKRRRGIVEPEPSLTSTAPAAVKLLAELTGYWPGDDVAPALVKEFGDTPDEPALRRAVELWRMSTYKLTNWLGIAEWYQEIRRRPDWTPQDRFKNGNGKANFRNDPDAREAHNRAVFAQVASEIESGEWTPWTV